MTQHPELHAVDVVCANCGTSFGIRSTAAASCRSTSARTATRRIPARPAWRVSGSRIERFNRRLGLAAA